MKHCLLDIQMLPGGRVNDEVSRDVRESSTVIQSVSRMELWNYIIIQ